MAAKEGATKPVGSYPEFEPFGRWQRSETRDTLTLEVPDFKKEELRVLFNRRGILKVSGERPLVGASGTSKFYRELPVPKHCDTRKIAAKWYKNELTIILPKLAEPKEQGKKLTKIALDAGMVLIFLATIVAFVLYMYTQKPTLVGVGVP